MDHLFTLNEDTPKLRCVGKTGVAPSLLFGMDSKLGFESTTAEEHIDVPHHTEVETATIWRGSRALLKHQHVCSSAECDHAHATDHDHVKPSSTNFPALTHDLLAKALTVLPKESVYRVKGFVRLSGAMIILNWAFGRWDVVLVASDGGSEEADSPDVRLTMMGEPGEVKRTWAPRLAEAVGGTVV